jgi:uncharacterized protein (TIGR02466 family)
MNTQFTIDGLFPTPIISSNINRSWTDKELALFDYHRDHCHNNMGNTTSNDRYVLNAPEAKGLVGFIGQGIQHYVDKIICPKNPVEFYITQSWLNYTKPGEYHHTHEHPNSIISGVFYIDADRDHDKIIFHKANRYQQIKFPQTEYNAFNSESWFFNVGNGDLKLFPSSLTHNVEQKKGDNVSCSLAFNVFAKGYIGAEEELTALHLRM